MQKNQRQSTRITISLEVELNYQDEANRNLITRDASPSGMFLLCENHSHYNLGEMVKVRYLDIFNDKKVTEKDAIIVRHDPNGFGVAYVEIDGF